MGLDVAGALETGEDERVFSTADDVFYDPGLLRVEGSATDEGMEDLDQVQDVFVDLAFGGLSEVEEVEKLDLEADSLAADHDVVVVDVAVVFAAGVNGSDAFG